MSADNKFLVGSIIIAGALIAGAVIFVNFSGPVTPPSSGGSALNNNIVPVGGSGEKVNVEVGDLPLLGDSNAPVLIVEFSDFQCLFCRKFWQETLTSIKNNYINTGKVKMAYRDFPLENIHETAQKYAEATRCANDQNKFWQMHDKIFKEQGSWDKGTITGITATDIKKWAREIGLNGQTFDSCLDSGKYIQAVQKDLQAGRTAGVQGTPTFFINGKKLTPTGALPYESFVQAIDAALAGK